jgi:hypothetical protein
MKQIELKYQLFTVVVTKHVWPYFQSRFPPKKFQTCFFLVLCVFLFVNPFVNLISQAMSSSDDLLYLMMIFCHFLALRRLPRKENSNKSRKLYLSRWFNVFTYNFGSSIPDGSGGIPRFRRSSPPDLGEPLDALFTESLGLLFDVPFTEPSGAVDGVIEGLANGVMEGATRGDRGCGERGDEGCSGCPKESRWRQEFQDVLSFGYSHPISFHSGQKRCQFFGGGSRWRQAFPSTKTDAQIAHEKKNQRNKNAKKAMINTSEIAPIDCSIESASFDSAPIDIPSEIVPIDCSIEIALFDSASIGIPFVAEVVPIGCSFEIDSRPATSQSSSLVTSTMALNLPDDDEVCAWIWRSSRMARLGGEVSLMIQPVTRSVTASEPHDIMAARLNMPPKIG